MSTELSFSKFSAPVVFRMSMFQPAAEISSSDSQTSDAEDYIEFGVSTDKAEHGNRSPGRVKEEVKSLFTVDSDQGNASDVSQYSLPDVKDMLDVDVAGHTNMMTSALLEFYCLSRAADILNSQKGSHKRYTRDSPEVQYLGKKMYAYKCQFLSSHGLLAGGVEKEELGKTRQYYRDNLDLLGVAALEKMDPNDFQRQQSSIASPRDLEKISKAFSGKQFLTDQESAGSPRVETGRWSAGNQVFDNDKTRALEDIPLDMGDLLDPMLSIFPSSPVSFPLFSPEQPGSKTSRYAVEFSEVKILGRGSFGEVYHVRNHIDGQDYAVKKIPLSHKRLEQLRSGGRDQLEKIMREIRTLARLEHTNVVRYYGAWVEQADTPRHAGRQSPLKTGSEHTKSNLISQGSTTDGQSFGIVFENSEKSTAESDSGEYNADGSDMSHLLRNRIPTKDTGDDEDVESIPRDFGTVSQSQLSTMGATDDIFTDGLSQEESKLQIERSNQQGLQAPAIILHIQMSVHPISLSSYLNPQSPGADRLSRRHCFHLIPSLKLMLGIISGVEYLHSKGIVHRDLKPANIFLSPPEDKLQECPTCKLERGTGTPYCHPRIGDFGLVADISHFNDGEADSRLVLHQKSHRAGHVVGTEFYRPCVHSDNASLYSIDEKLDVYALGVILFELLYRFDTKMERQLVLAQLTRGSDKYNHSFTGQMPCSGDFMKKVDLGSMMLEDGTPVSVFLIACIMGMLEPNPQQRWSCQGVKESLERLLAAVAGAYAQQQ